MLQYTARNINFSERNNVPRYIGISYLTSKIIKTVMTSLHPLSILFVSVPSYGKIIAES